MLYHWKAWLVKSWNELLAISRYCSPMTRIIAGLLVIFFLILALFGPQSLSPGSYQVLIVLSSLLGAVFGFLLTGELGFQIEPVRARFGYTAVKATGGFLAYLLALLWWSGPWVPAVSESDQPDTRAALAEAKLEAVQKAVASLREELAIRRERIPLQQRWLKQGINAEPSFRAQELAAQIPDQAAPEALALKAIVQKRFDEARRLLAEAQGRGAELSALYEAMGTTEQYAGHYAEALQWFEKLLALRPDDPALLVKAATALQLAGKYPEAESLYQRSLAEREKDLGPNHPEVANELNRLAILYYAQGNQPRAEVFLKRALAIREKTFGPEHPEVAASLDNLAGLYYAQRRHAKAEPLLQRALAIREKTFGPEHPEVAASLNRLAALYDTQLKRARAEPLLQRALAIREKTFGPEHPEVAASLKNLAELYLAQGKYAQAEPLLRRALMIREKTVGSTTHLEVLTALEAYAHLLRKMDRAAEAVPLETRARAILAKLADANSAHSLK